MEYAVGTDIKVYGTLAQVTKVIEEDGVTVVSWEIKDTGKLGLTLAGESDQGKPHTYDTFHDPEKDVYSGEERKSFNAHIEQALAHFRTDILRKSA